MSKKHQIYTVKPAFELNSFTTSNELIKINGHDAVGFSTTYFAAKGDSATMSFNIVNEDNELQTQLDSNALGYPEILVLPVPKMAGSGATAKTVDEIYFSTTLVAGVVSVTGSFDRSGNYKLITERINDSLAAIKADWRIKKSDVTFMVTS